MTPPLFLLDALPPGDTLVLDGAEAHHAVRVRRMRAGEVLVVADGRGNLAECTVAQVGGETLTLTVHRRRHDPPPRPRLVVAQAPPKGERSELAVELMTELGVDEILPWSAQRCEVHWRGERQAKALARWRRAAREAAKQSRRSWVPVVGETVSTAHLARRVADGAGATAAGLVLDEQAAQPLTAVALPDVAEIVLVVGPEGGLTDDERGALADAGAPGVRLGRPVLRASTAGAAALAVLSARLGRWA